MKLYIKQRIFTWRSKFDITDENGNLVFYCEGEIFTWGRKLHIFDANNNEVIYLKQRLFTFMPKYEIYVNGQFAATLIKKFTFFTHDFFFEGINWKINGDFFAHEYQITNDNETVVHISKHWFTWGDTYELDVNDKYDLLLCLASCVVIDCVCHEGNNG